MDASRAVVLSGVAAIFLLEGEQRLFFTSYRLWQNFIFLNRPLLSKHFLLLLSQTDKWMTADQRGKRSILRARLTSCISSPTVYTNTFFKFTSFQIRTPELNVCHYRKPHRSPPPVHPSLALVGSAAWQVVWLELLPDFPSVVLMVSSLFPSLIWLLDTACLECLCVLNLLLQSAMPQS